MHKKKILFISNHHRRFTGFGKNLKNILTYLYKTEKYEIVEAANGIINGHAEGEQVAPWKVVGHFRITPHVSNSSIRTHLGTESFLRPRDD